MPRLLRSGPIKSQLVLSVCGMFFSLSAVAAQQPSIPKVVVDAQLGLAVTASGAEVHLDNPAGVAVAPDGTIYVADSSNSRIVAVSTQGAILESPATDPARIGGTAAFLTPPDGLSQPNAVAVGPDGTLYFSDAAKKVLYRVTEPESGTPVYSKLAYGANQSPTALAVDAAGDLWVADARLQEVVEFGPKDVEPARKQKVQPLIPTGIAVSATSLYVSDAATNAIYGQGTADPLLTGFSGTAFNFASDLAAARPTGLAVDQAGNLFVLDSFNRRLLELQSGKTVAAFSVPFSKLDAPAGLGIGPSGNLYITDQAEHNVTELVYGGNAINFGDINEGTSSSKVILNYLFNAATSATGMYQQMQGGRTSAFSFDNRECLKSEIKAGYSCRMKFQVNYQAGAPGLHKGVVALSNRSSEVLGAMESYGTSQSALVAFYPALVNILSQASPYPSLLEPQAAVVTGTGDHLFVADEGRQVSGSSYTYAGTVWDYPTANGVPTGAPANIGGASLVAPIALALDASGNLYIADYSQGAIFKSPAGNRSSLTRQQMPAGITLNHPIALTFDPSGNLYIGDTGPAGVLATASNPGSVFEIAPDFQSGTQYHYKVGTAPVIYPQGLATDPSGNLYIADGGDGHTNFGDLVLVQAGTGTTSYIPTGSYTLSEPGAVVLDAALNLYVLDGYNSRLLLVPVTLTNGVPSFGTATQLQALPIAVGAGMAIWPQGEMTITDIGENTNAPQTQVITLQTNTASASFGPIPRGSSQSGTVTAINIGNTPANLSPYPTETGDVAGFSVATPLCAGGIAPQQQCTLDLTYTPDQFGSTTAQFQIAVLPSLVSTNYIDVSGTSTKATPAVVLSVPNPNLTYPNGTNATVTVSGNFGTATGQAQIYDGSTLLTTVILGYNGIGYGYINYGALPAGTQTLTAVYSGDVTYTAATSLPVVLTVAPEATTLTLSCYSSNGGSYGGNYICNAYTNATGNVVFTSDGVPNTVAINGGTAAFTVTAPQPGNHTIVVSYAQQGNFATATPVSQSYTISRASTQTQLVPSSYYVQAGKSVTLTANVVSYNPTAYPSAGTVTFTDSASSFNAQCTLNNGSCAVVVAAPASGTHTYTANFQGTTQYSASSGGATIGVAP